jgi:uncharacterized protein (DUF1697 family)
MPQHVALLRGINVGGHRVKMDRLRALFEGIGLEDVSTVIASGNVVFSSKAKNLRILRKKIERVLEGELGYEVPTFLRTPAELAALKPFVSAHDRASYEPWDSHYVMFLQEPVPTELAHALSELSSGSDAFLFAEREIHWRVRGRLRDSPLFGRVVDNALGETVTTMRNMQTVRRILRKTAASA